MSVTTFIVGMVVVAGVILGAFVLMVALLGLLDWAVNPAHPPRRGVVLTFWLALALLCVFGMSSSNQASGLRGWVQAPRSASR